jgi:hypothetical protein
MSITCRLIAETVCTSYDVKLLDLYSARRDRQIILPRHMSWALARRLTRRSLPEIGRLMGGRDHTTVFAGIRKIEQAMETDAEIAANFQTLTNALTLLGEASDKSARLSVQFGDVDPVDTAYRILNAPLREASPSLEEIRALAMGVLHYQAEMEIALRKAEAPRPPPPGPEQIIVYQPGDPELKKAGGTVLARWASWQDATFAGAGAMNARRSFETALKTLQTTIERT